MTSPKIMNSTENRKNKRDAKCAKGQQNRAKSRSPHESVSRTSSLAIPYDASWHVRMTTCNVIDLNGNPQFIYGDGQFSPVQKSAFMSGSPESQLSISPSSSTAYAGAKFLDPPSPNVLPAPPSHWVDNEDRTPSSNFMAMSNHLKMMLNVPS